MIIKKPSSFKKRLLMNLLISSLIPLILIGYISYVTIFTLYNNNIEDGIQNNLKQIQISLTYAIMNLENSSLQLSVDDVRIASKIDEYLKSDNIMNKYNLKQEITDSLAILNTVSPDLGAIFFYLSGQNEIIFENNSIDSNFNFSNLPVISEEVNYNLFGPHKSAQFSSSHSVLSILRKIYLLKDIELYVYIETNFKEYEELLESQTNDSKVGHILINNRGEIIYSQLANDFPVGTTININMLDYTKKSDLVKEGYYVFAEKGQHGLYTLAAINKRNYNDIFIKWVTNYALFALLSFMISAALAYYIWRMVYRPLKRLNADIGSIAQNKFNTEIKKTGIIEFDSVLSQFQDAKFKIAELIRQVEEKENKKRIVEVQNLLHQINPHFLHNTLNTIQWLAKINGQDEIDRLVALFTRVLHYNLGKEGGIVRLREEIDALKDYIELHRFRYDHQFDVMMEIDNSLMDIQIPRFIMQPIVENAIYHGLKYEDGTIEIVAQKADKYLTIFVRDYGSGMSEEDIEALMTENSDDYRKGGMGIGLSYVKNMLEIYYGEEALLEVRKNVDKGTTFTIKLPVKK